MADPTQGVPSLIENGNSYSFLLSYSDYPVGTYTLTFCIQSGNSAPKIVTATTSGSSFLVSLSTSVTQDLTIGEATFAAYATASGVRKTAETGKLRVTCNLATERPRTYAQQQLEHWQAQYALLDRQLQSASSVIQSTKFSPQKLREEIQHWQAVVAIEAKREELAFS